MIVFDKGRLSAALIRDVSTHFEGVCVVGEGRVKGLTENRTK